MSASPQPTEPVTDLDTALSAPGWLTPETAAVFTGMVLLLGGALLVRQWLRQRELVARHPNEPWIWDHSWRHELVDEQLSTVLSRLPSVVIGVLVVGLFTLVIFVGDVNEDPGLMVFVRVCLAFADGLFLWEVVIPYARQVLALLRFGRMRLCLPGIPLALGSRCQVSLVARRSLAQLQHMRVTLRRVREREVVKHFNGKRRTRTVRDVEYEHAHQVDARALRDGKPLPIELNVPKAKPGDSTALSKEPRVLWELQLTSDVPGVDLDTTFIIPVYAVKKGSSRQD